MSRGLIRHGHDSSVSDGLRNRVCLRGVGIVRSVFHHASVARPRGKAVLSDYLASVARRPFKPGSLDCCIFMADWIRMVIGRDPIADRRGTYATTREYRKMLHQEGGFVVACDARAKTIGLRETAAPQVGDPMLVSAPVGVRHGKVLRFPTGSICVSDTMRAVVSSDRGLVIAHADYLPTVKAWTF